MQRTVLSLLLGLLAVSSSAFAGDWKLLPVRDADFKPEITVSAVAGSLDPQHSGAGTYSGIELALNCLLLQPPSGVMRRSSRALRSRDSRWTNHRSRWPARRDLPQVRRSHEFPAHCESGASPSCRAPHRA